MSVDHLHVPLVSVREQAAVLVGRLRRLRAATFRALVSDCDTTMLVVGRFLALLELYREGVVAFEQVSPLGDLTIRWTGSDDGSVDVQDEYDDADELAVRELGAGPEGHPDAHVDELGESETGEQTEEEGS